MTAVVVTTAMIYKLLIDDLSVAATEGLSTIRACHGLEVEARRRGVSLGEQSIEPGPGLILSFVLACPNCGPREVTDFGFGGEVNPRPRTVPSERELGAYNYFRDNAAGVQREWWFHRSGCGEWFLAERHTSTNVVLLTKLPDSAI